MLKRLSKHDPSGTEHSVRRQTNADGGRQYCNKVVFLLVLVPGNPGLSYRILAIGTSAWLQQVTSSAYQEA